MNRWQPRAQRRMKRLEGADVRVWVGFSAATEHFTAILAEYLLSRPEVLNGTEPRLATLWLWHSCEESEHRSTAFDLYRALGGNESWRLRLFRTATLYFLLDALRQTVNNLWHDGSFWQIATWASGWRFLLGRDGLLRGTVPAWKRYLHADFHPAQQDATPAVQWLRDNAAQFEVVGRPA